jgi:hypothetical protein
LAACGGGGGSGSGDSNRANWIIPTSEVVDGGVGRGGIPSIDQPQWIAPAQTQEPDDGLVVGYKADGTPRAAPYSIMDWHEVLNDDLTGVSLVISYCPLTGSPLVWESGVTGDTRFQVSGLLYRSNLILIDVATESHWSQMLEQAVEGSQVRATPVRRPAIETTYETWLEMYPDSEILSRATGFSRDYDDYPYGDYRTNGRLLFSVGGLDDRLFEKERVLGVNVGTSAMAYPVDRFLPDFEVLNEVLDEVPYVVAGAAQRATAVAYARTLADGTVLEFERSPDPLPALLIDNEGTTWDIFGEAVAGPRAGEQLGIPGGAQGRVQNAYWFAWAAFNPDSLIWSP